MKYHVLKAPNTVVKPEDYPWHRTLIMGSPKLDGHRALISSSETITPQGFAVANREIGKHLGELQTLLEENDCCLDGELYDPRRSHFGAISSILNSRSAPIPNELAFYVFDWIPEVWRRDKPGHFTDIPFGARLLEAERIVKQLGNPRVKMMVQQPMNGPADAEAFFQTCLVEGHEGAIMRATEIWREGNWYRGGFYKVGNRTTEAECCIWKMKATVTYDGYIVGVKERKVLAPDTERMRDDDGLLLHPKYKDAFVGGNTLGSLLVRSAHPDGTSFDTYVSLGPGFTMEDRKRMWLTRESLAGRWIEFKHMPHGAIGGSAVRSGRMVRYRDDIRRVPEVALVVESFNA